MQQAIDDPGERLPAVVTFLVAASGIAVLGVSAAFWALLAGLVVRTALHLGRRGVADGASGRGAASAALDSTLVVTRLSNYFLRTLREDPSDAEVTSHRLLVRAGYIRRNARASSRGCHSV